MTDTAPPEDRHALLDDVAEQIAELHLDRAKPLIVSDADEVLVQFMVGLERFLERNGYWLDLSSFAITGNIKRLGTDEAVPREDTPKLLEEFFASDVELLDPVEGAANALAALEARGAQVVVLTNLPPERRAGRARHLARHDMDYPVIANRGLKGAAVRELGRQTDQPLVFLDDLPHNIKAVAEAHEPSHRIHFIADPRLAKMMPKAEHSHHRVDTWDEAQRYIERYLFGD